MCVKLMKSNFPLKYLLLDDRTEVWQPHQGREEQLSALLQLHQPCSPAGSTRGCQDHRAGTARLAAPQLAGHSRHLYLHL